MRRADINSGFFICWILNMLLNWEFGALAILLWIPYQWFGFSWYPAAAIAGFWVLGAFALTCFFTWASGSNEIEKRSRELKNVNPYSAKPYVPPVVEEAYEELHYEDGDCDEEGLKLEQYLEEQEAREQKQLEREYKKEHKQS